MFKTKTQRSLPGAGQVGSIMGTLVVSGIEASTALCNSAIARRTVSLPSIKTSAKEQPEAEAKFTDTLINRGASVRAGSPYRLSGTTIRNALLPFEREGAPKSPATIQ